MKRFKLKQFAGGLAVGLAATMTPAHAVSVALELQLLADVSGSLDAADFALQRDGYVSAFRSAALINAIVDRGPIAVSLVYWSGGQQVAVDWTLLSNAASSNAFADAIAAAGRPSSGATAMANAMNFATARFAGNGFEGRRLVMDVSGDGANNTPACAFNVLNCAPVQSARDNALAKGVTTINALWIEDKDQPSSRRFFCLDANCMINPLTYGAMNVLGGANPFQAVASSFDADVFERAIGQKLLREIVEPKPGGPLAPVPEPGSIALISLGLLGLGALLLRPRGGTPSA